ncbi:MAG: aspartate aminotransferase family protein [Methylophilales bacterium]|jgi:acetylornithine/N-succinyldiaminopimelate aminotransferase|nr:aspartate aminotransferase family protein [Methylophilales bacterium]
MSLIKNSLLNTYKRLPVSFVKGEGVWLFDKLGNKYLDGLSGVAVNTLGHNHPDLVKTITEQAKKLIHVSNYYHIEEQCLLAKKITSLSKLSSVFFCNSGCEANEASIKLARLHGHSLSIDNPEIIVMEKAFHGRTMATLSATGSRKAQAGFEPLMSGFIRVPFDDLEAIDKIATKKNKVTAILVEPIQGEGGVNVPANFISYLVGLRKICDKNNWLLIFDEVQCGVGRTGKWFAHQHAGVLPDIMTLAKGLASGVPIGACVVNEKTEKLISPGKHGSTFGGNPLACAAGLTTLNVIERDGLMSNAVRQGKEIVSILEKGIGNHDGVKSIRHMGLMIGVELNKPCYELIEIALGEKLLINVTADNVIRLLPPLIISHSEATLLAEHLIKIIDKFLDA